MATESQGKKVVEILCSSGASLTETVYSVQQTCRSLRAFWKATVMKTSKNSAFRKSSSSKRLVSESTFCVIYWKILWVVWGSQQTWAGHQSSNASKWWDNCHKHALFVQLAQTRLSFDIWLMLSRGTAAGCRKESGEDSSCEHWQLRLLCT